VVRSILWGVIIIAIGLWVWLANLGVMPSGIVFSRDWPIIIVIVGLMAVAEGIARWIRGRRW
jgi:hypothetical protein